MRTLALTILALTAASPALAQQEEVWRGAVAQGAWLGAVTSNGDVRVTEADGGTATVRADVRRGDRGDVRFEILEDDGRVTVCAVTPDVRRCDHDGLDSRGGNDRDRIIVDLHVTLPRGAHVRASSGNGDVLVSAAAGEARASSGNGGVDVSGVQGPVSASSGNGAVRVEGVTGPVRASSGNGRIDVDAVRGPVRASSGNGDVRVRMAQLPEATDMRFSSGNGNIEVTLPADFSGEVEARSGSGSIDSDFPMTVQGRMSRGRLEGVIGQGGPRLELSTGNGWIRLRRGS